MVKIRVSQAQHIKILRATLAKAIDTLHEFKCEDTKTYLEVLDMYDSSSQEGSRTNGQ